MKPITVTSYNLHKGMSPLNRRVHLNEMADALQTIDTDVLFLQEVQGQHTARQQKFDAFPEAPHDLFLAQRLSLFNSYGKNAVYPERHHGNAVLSRLPLHTCGNLDLTVNPLEQRGLLHCEIRPEGWPLPLVCLCLHLNLLEYDRAKQYRIAADYIANEIPEELPLVLAGDFNDWRQQSCSRFAASLGLQETFSAQTGSLPKTFPARFPLLSLDRIYTRRLKTLHTEVHQSEPWNKLSDHLPISAKLVFAG